MAVLSPAVCLILPLFLCGCSRTHGKTALSGEPQGNPTPSQLTAWSWLPPSSAHAAELATIPAGAALALTIPKDHPISTHSEAPGGIDSQLNFVPTVKKSLIVDGGSLISQLGPVKKTAQWGDWGVVWSDAQHNSRAGWGYCLTAGDLILPRPAFEHPPGDRFAQNFFTIEPYGDHYVLLHFNPARGQRVCWLGSPFSGGPTAAWVGSKAEINGQILERHADGWYAGPWRMSN